jgi:cytochrome P450 family 6
MLLWISFEALCIASPLFLWGLYWYGTKTFNYWKEKGIHYAEPTIFFGNIKDRVFLRTSFHEFQRDLYRRFDGHKYAGERENCIHHVK